MEMTIDKVMHALASGMEKAKSINSPSSIAVVDAGRNTLAFVRMDGALLASIEISHGKAYTACSMRCRTSALSALVQPGAALFGLETTHRRSLVTFGGGVPISVGAEVVGAVGVAGGTVEQDEEVATEVANALSRGG